MNNVKTERERERERERKGKFDIAVFRRTDII